MNYSGHVDYANYVYLLLQFENPRSICCSNFIKHCEKMVNKIAQWSSFLTYLPNPNSAFDIGDADFYISKTFWS